MPELSPEQIERFLLICQPQWIDGKQINGTDVLVYFKKLERRVVSLALALADRGNLS